ncbi:S-Ena type endospore appendage [Bacillus sp. AFS053548]|uniref:S-Ena type endospore appendage n=1 Tax=Bacillus sp. AFS053548 TaxID=2033505 RepID=UPI000BFCAE76|nr:S-Ena type endospore appendage [Bacillus sp. AFS053548]PGM53299.1 group-specific protein [Bacillus sp. AFS053548]
MKQKRPDVPNLPSITLPVSPPTPLPPLPPPAPPTPPKPIPTPTKCDPCIPIDLCGNILIQDNLEKPVELWSLGGGLTALATISVYNNEASTGPIKIEVCSNICHIITVLPGNTSSYTSQHIKSVTILQSGQTPIYLEGKYCITGKIIDK